MGNILSTVVHKGINAAGLIAIPHATGGGGIGEMATHPPPDIGTLSQHFRNDIGAMDHASQSGTVSAEEWQAFYTFLYRLATTAHDAGSDTAITNALHTLQDALQGTEYDDFDAQAAISAASKFLSTHTGLSVLAFLAEIHNGTSNLDLSADPEVEQALRSGVQSLGSAEEDFEQFEGNDGTGGAQRFQPLNEGV